MAAYYPWIVDSVKHGAIFINVGRPVRCQLAD